MKLGSIMSSGPNSSLLGFSPPKQGQAPVFRAENNGSVPDKFLLLLRSLADTRFHGIKVAMLLVAHWFCGFYAGAIRQGCGIAGPRVFV